MFFDWHQFQRSNAATPAVVDPRRRLRFCLLGFAVMAILVFARVVELEVSEGAGFRDEALRPIERETPLPAPRGRILARDGTVLACDRTIRGVAVQYRWLQEPPDQQWVGKMARSRLPKTDRRNAEKLAAEKANVLAERVDLAARLARLCGLSPRQWAARTRRIQARVERIAESANARRASAAVAPERADDSWGVRVRRLLLDDPPAPRIVVKEELEPQVVVEDVAPAVVSEISAHGDRYPSTTIVQLSRRTYPQATLAAHILGHVGQDREDEFVGRTGVEKQYETILQGHPGTAVEQTDRGGRTVTSYRREEPVAGQDVTLTLDLTLQQTAEQLIEAARERRRLVAAERGQNYLLAATKRAENSSDPFLTDPFLTGGAVAVMDVRTGAILAAAAAPAFDPNLFAGGDDERLAALLSDPSKPLFDRVSRMAIPPGSAFKTLTAVALLETGTVGPETSLTCQGYLHHPDRQRCELFVRQGIGHGEVTLCDALAVSCNVYFFHFAGRMGPRPLVDWAGQFGFGRPTGIDLPGETAGRVPCPENIGELEGRTWRTSDTQLLAVGQSSLMVTPLQMLRMMAAVANGGWLVTPHVERDRGMRGEGRGARDEGRKRVAVSQRTLQTVREGLRRVVADTKGTAHGTAYMQSTAIAGKTGTAETGGDRPSHAWFVGYAPADNPKVAFVVVLEHAGSGGTSAGPVAKRLVVRMEQLGIL
jgi:penicillin-binding protein 2